MNSVILSSHIHWSSQTKVKGCLRALLSYCVVLSIFSMFLGREEGQMWYPRKVAVIRHSGKYVVCDRGNERSRMQIFTKNGHFIKKIAIRYIDIVAGLAISHAGT